MKTLYLVIIIFVLIVSYFVFYDVSSITKKNKLIEGLENNCNSELKKTEMIYNNNAIVQQLKNNMDDLMNKVNKVIADETMQNSRISNIESEIQNAKAEADNAKSSYQQQALQMKNAPSFD